MTGSSAAGARSSANVAESQAGRTVPAQDIPVARIRPEDGLGRKRDREGHRELQRSIQRFGVLTPITVRLAPDGSGDYLLIKGQGRTLACQMLGHEMIPAIVADESYAVAEKVQLFLVENVARLKMRPVDRALLIHRARQDGEETSHIARRFGVAPTTVRRLLAQLDGASSSEVAALRAGKLKLAIHAVVARHALPAERAAVLAVVARTSLNAKELEGLFIAFGWNALVSLGPRHSQQRLILMSWACSNFAQLPAGSIKDRLRQLAIRFPTEFERQDEHYALVVQ